MTTGQQVTQMIRKSFRIGTRTRDYREGFSMKEEILESVQNAVTLPGYYGPERTELSRSAWGAVISYRKHVDGFRIPGELRFHITSMSPYQFAALLGQMVDAGVTNTGEGERFFSEMRKRVAA